MDASEKQSATADPQKDSPKKTPADEPTAAKSADKPSSPKASPKASPKKKDRSKSSKSARKSSPKKGDAEPAAADAAKESAKEESSPESPHDPTPPMTSGPLVLRVKRRVSDEARPTVAMHSKRVRLTSQQQQQQQAEEAAYSNGGCPTVFHLAGTLHSASDEAELSDLISRAIYRDDTDTADSTASPGPNRERDVRRRRRPRRQRYRVVGRHDSRLPPNERMKRKCSPRVSEDSEDGDPVASKYVCVFDVEPAVEESPAPRCAGGSGDGGDSDDLYAPTLEEYRRQLEGITVNGQRMLCSDVRGAEEMEADAVDYVYDLYVASGPTVAPGELLLGDEDEDDRWSLVLGDYDEQYAGLDAMDPDWLRWRSRALMEEDLDSNPDSESNWRNDYPDLNRPGGLDAYDEEEFDLWMAGREPERLMRDSDDDDLRIYAQDVDLDGMSRDLELARGVEIAECGNEDEDEDDDLEKARERRYESRSPVGRRSVRQMMADLAVDRQRPEYF